jgi:hypothetical protein
MAICGALRSTSYDKLLSELGWPRIIQRAEFLNVTLFYKVVLLHLTFQTLSWINVEETLRSNIELLPPYSRTDRYLQSFIPSACRLWNSLTLLFHSINSLNLFKLKYKRHFFSTMDTVVDY